MPTLDQILSRAGDNQLEELIGPGTVRLLRMKNPDFKYGQTLKETIKKSYGLSGLLENKKTRNLIFEILRPDDAKELCKLLQGRDCSEPYNALYRMNFHKGSEKEKKLYSFFSESPPEAPEIEIRQDKEMVLPEYPLFRHQIDILSKAEEFLFSGKPGKRLIIHMPTGAGKTRTSMHLIMRFLNQNPGAWVLWLAYSEELCEQAIEEFRNTWAKHGSLPAEIIRFFGAYNAPEETENSALIVAGLDKIYNAIIRNGDLKLQNLLLNHVKLIIMDEAHQAIAPTYKEILERLTLRDTPLIGLTATPGRSYEDEGANQELSRFFQAKRIQMEIPDYSNPVEYLTESGYLASTTFQEISDFESDAVFSVTAAALDFSDQLLQSIGADEKRNLAILNKIEELCRKHKRIIYFAPSVDNARAISHALLTLGIQSFFLSGATGKTIRRTIIETFKSDSDIPMILCNFGVLTTGFDAPKTSCAVIGRPTKSLVLYSQMAGRAIRGPRAGGNASAEVFTVTDTKLKGFGAISDAFIYWNNFYKK